MPLTLHVRPAEGEPHDLPLGATPILIGRADDADLVLADRYVSRYHARLLPVEGGVVVEDLGSRNGTRVNGLPVLAATTAEPGDVIAISGSLIEVVDPNAQTATRDPALERRAEPLPDGTILRSASELLAAAGPAAAAGTGEGEELRRLAERLALSNEVHRVLGASRQLDELLALILERISAHLMPEAAVVYLRGPRGRMERAAVHPPGYPYAEEPFSSTLTEEVIDRRQAALVDDARIDERFDSAESMVDAGVRSLVAAPLLDAEGALGMIVLTSRSHTRRFSEDDLSLLVSLAAAAALRIRNLSLAEDAAERRRLGRELELARQIQVALLPERLPAIPGWELHAGNLPSRGVSGDHYEVASRRGGDELVLWVADVSGKGMAASLLTAALAAMSAAPMAEGLPPEGICAQLSRRLLERTPPERYVTAFVAVLRPATGHLAYTNAGHTPALLVRAAGGCDQLASTGPPLGLLPDAAFARAEVNVDPATSSSSTPTASPRPPTRSRPSSGSTA